MVAGLTHRLTKFGLALSADGPRDPDPATDELFDIVGRNADIESYAVHARVLVEFFYEDVRKKNNAIAADFFEKDEDWQRIRPPQAPALAPILKRASTEVAHLNYSRKAPSPNWSYGEIWSALKNVIDVFIDHASPDRVDEGSRTTVRKLLAPWDLYSLTRLALLRATEAVPPGAMSWDEPSPGGGGTATSADLPKPPTVYYE